MTFFKRRWKRAKIECVDW